ncbi:MAG: response regulator [Massilia sp.]|nr:response regulator [Massilia sp.]
MEPVKRPAPLALAAAAASLLALGICLLAAFAWQASTRPFGTASLIERHQGMSAKLDGMMICMLQVEMAHERYLAAGRAEDREGRDKALATLGAALRAVDPAVLEQTGHAPRFYLIQQHAARRLPSWLTVPAPAPALAPASARGMLRTSTRLPQGPGGEERLLAAREAAYLDTLLVERGKGERTARTSLALLGAVMALALMLALGLVAATARAKRRAGGAGAGLPQQMGLRRAELDEARLAGVAGTRLALLEREDAIAAQERQRISRDMHDGIGQDLFALKLELERFYARTRRRHPHLQAGVKQMVALVDDVMANLRSVIDDLRPAGLEHGLEAAIRSQVEKFRRRSGNGCRVELQVEAPFDPAAADVAATTAAFRILQEALTNIRRHARATHVRVQVSQRGDQLFMSITDNGCGFGPAPRLEGASFGLLGMRERVGALGGMLDIDSAPGRGTSLAVAIPLRPPA